MGLGRILRTLGADLQRYTDPDVGALGQAQELLSSQGVWATTVYRYGQWVYSGRRTPLGLPGRLAYKAAQKAVEVTTGISLPASADIGPGFYIGHFGTIIVHPDTRMGSGCYIGQGVTLGTRGQGDKGVPVLGDNVYIGAGAKVLGGIQLGDNASVGANAVVVKDVPPDNVAVGIPAKARPRKS